MSFEIFDDIRKEYSEKQSKKQKQKRDIFFCFKNNLNKCNLHNRNHSKSFTFIC